MLDTAVIDDVMRRFGKAFFNNDLAALAEVVTEDFEWHFAFGPDAPDGHIYRGVQEVGQGIIDHSQRFQELRFDGISICGAGEDQIVMTYQLAGRFADGREINLRGIELLTLRGNRLAKKDVFWKQYSPPSE